jgi:hypothetical protein
MTSSPTESSIATGIVAAVKLQVETKTIAAYAWILLSFQSWLSKESGHLRLSSHIWQVARISTEHSSQTSNRSQVAW